MNNVTRIAAYISEGGVQKARRGRPRLHASAADKQAAYRERKQPARIEPGARVIHRTYGKGIVTSVHKDRFIVAFLTDGRIWRDLPAAELTFDGRTKKLPSWTDASKPLSKNWKPWRKWQTRLPAAAISTAFDGERVAVPTYGVRKAGKRKVRRDYTKLINHNLAVLVERAYAENTDTLENRDSAEQGGGLVVADPFGCQRPAPRSDFKNN